MKILKNEEYSKLNDTINSLSSEVTNLKSAYSDLDNMITREKQKTNMSEYVQRGIQEVGDPYHKVSLVRASIHKIADNIASLPFHILDENDEVLSDNHPVVRLFNTINTEDDPYTFFYEIISNLYRTGRSFTNYSDQKRQGLPVAFFNLPSSDVEAKTKDGYLSHWLYNKKTKIEPEEMLFLRFVDPDNKYSGMSPIQTSLIEILQFYYLNVYNLSVFENGGHAKGYWTRTDGFLNPAQLQQADQVLNQTFGGFEKNTKQKVVPPGLDYKVISNSQKDMEFVSLLHEVRDSILITFGIPKALFGFADTTFNNMREAKRSFWNNTLIPLMNKIESQFKSNFFAKHNLPYKLHFDRDAIGDLKDTDLERREIAQIDYALGVPFQQINEKLGLGYEEFEGLDTSPNNNRITLSSPIEQTKESDTYIIEKNIPFDDFLRKAELKRTQEYYKSAEENLAGLIKKFWSDAYRNDIAPQLRNLNKDLDDDIAKLISYIEGLDYKTSFVDFISEAIKNIFNRGAERSFNGVGVDFNLPDNLAGDYIASRGLILRDAPETLKHQIINAITSKEGWTIDELAKTISKTWDKASTNRAKVIARTETTRAYNNGRMRAAQELGIKKMEWVSAGDSNVRDEHQHNDGEVRWIGEPYPNGEAYPGESSPNCRCTLVSRLD